MEPILFSIAVSIHLVTFKSEKIWNFFKLTDIKSDDSGTSLFEFKI